MRVLVVNDIHFTDRPTSSCTETYLPDLFDLLAAVRKAGEQARIDAEVWAGDVFHYKAPSRTSHALVGQVSDLIRERPWPVKIVPGNHDIRNDRTDSIPSQPLGMLFRAGAQLLDGWDTDGLPLYGVPWIQGYTGRVKSEEQLDQDVFDAMEQWRHQVFEHGWGNEHPLLVTHAPLYPPGFELTYEFYSSVKWANAMGGAGTCIYGHVHENHGMWKCDPQSEVQFVNFGALSRGSLHEHNLTREVAVAYYDSRAGAVKRVVLPHKPASEVFRLAEAGEARDVQQTLDSFLAAVGQSKLDVTAAGAVLERIEQLDLPRREEIVALARQLLEEVK